ncbi:hypothetical protein F9C11_30495 [Amycolatopsis sp. VS8301801F10]|uniref:hypothetical protein n=1 Tax=unclassified Amycolatopsis TaxID=2618356 RepID=UPI0038FC8CA0
MHNEESWSVLSAPTSNSVVLAVDFPAPGRPEAGFADLTAAMGSAWSAHGVLQTKLPAVTLADRPGPDTYLDYWTGDEQLSGREVVAVLGYCLGGVYAAEIAERIARRQSAEPAVVLFDGQVTDKQLLAVEIDKLIALGGPVLTADEASQARLRAAEIVTTPGIALADATDEIVALYREVATGAFRKVGLAPERGEEVVRFFETYMAWLTAAEGIDPASAWGRSLALTSTDFAALEENGSPTAVNAAKLIDQRVRLEVSHADLLRADDTARALRDHSGF